MGQKIEWETGMDAALNMARSTGRPVLLDFFNPEVVAIIIGLGRWPMATITVSTSKVLSDPATGMGRLLPELSGSPNAMLISPSPVTCPSPLPKMRMGDLRNSNLRPSSSACRISSSLGGISSRDLP